MPWEAILEKGVLATVLFAILFGVGVVVKWYLVHIALPKAKQTMDLSKARAEKEIETLDTVSQYSKSSAEAMFSVRDALNELVEHHQAEMKLIREIHERTTGA